MAQYNSPTEILPIFDSSVFVTIVTSVKASQLTGLLLPLSSTIGTETFTTLSIILGNPISSGIIPLLATSPISVDIMTTVGNTSLTGNLACTTSLTCNNTMNFTSAASNNSVSYKGLTVAATGTCNFSNLTAITGNPSSFSNASLSGNLTTTSSSSTLGSDISSIGFSATVGSGLSNLGLVGGGTITNLWTTTTGTIGVYSTTFAFCNATTSSAVGLGGFTIGSGSSNIKLSLGFQPSRVSVGTYLIYFNSTGTLSNIYIMGSAFIAGSPQIACKLQVTTIGAGTCNFTVTNVNTNVLTDNATLSIAFCTN